MIIKKNNGNKIKNSRLVISPKNLINSTFIVPLTILVYTIKEYTNVKNNPNKQKKIIKLLKKKEPKKIINSPTKLIVPGNPTLPKINKKKNTDQIGINNTIPP